MFIDGEKQRRHESSGQFDTLPRRAVGVNKTMSHATIGI